MDSDKKTLGPTIGGASQTDRQRDGVDRDGDGVINDGTEDERPTPKKKRNERRDSAPRTNEPKKPRDERRDGPWMNEAPKPRDERREPRQNTPPARPIPNNPRGRDMPARPIPNNPRGRDMPIRPIPNNPSPKKSLESDVFLRIDIKAIGGSVGRRIPGRPNVGKNPKDGDGDGFIVDLTTGLDNVPFKPVRAIDGSGSERNPMVAGQRIIRISPEMTAAIERMREGDKPSVPRKPTPDKPDAEEKPKFDLKPPPKNPNTKENIFDETNTESILREMNDSLPYIKKVRAALNGEGIPKGNLRRRDGQTEEAYQESLRRSLRDSTQRLRELQEALKRRGYADAETARLEYNRSKRGAKSLFPLDMFSDDNASISVLFTKE